MKKQLFFLFALSFFTLHLSAQVSGGFGLRAGLGLSTYNASAEGISVSFGKSSKAFARAFYISPISPVSSLQIEGGYSGRGLKINLGGFFGGQGGDASINFDVLELGLLYRYDISPEAPAHVYFLAGPMIGYAFNGTRKEDGMSSDIDFEAENLSQTDVSLELGAGLAFGPGGRISAELRFGFGLTNLSQENDPDEEASLNHRVIQIGMGYQF